MAKRTKGLTKLNDQLNEQMDIILRCTIENKKYGRLLLASPTLIPLSLCISPRYQLCCSANEKTCRFFKRL